MEKAPLRRAPGGAFSFRDLDVYRTMIGYATLEHEATRRFPAGFSWLRDQLDRAADSMLLNFGEGAGKKARSKDRFRYWSIALGSVTESASGWDLALVRGLCPKAVFDEALSALERIAAMLSAMRR